MQCGRVVFSDFHVTAAGLADNKGLFPDVLQAGRAHPAGEGADLHALRRVLVRAGRSPAAPGLPGPRPDLLSQPVLLQRAHLPRSDARPLRRRRALQLHGPDQLMRPSSPTSGSMGHRPLLAAALFLALGCQTYDFEPVTPVSLGQTTTSVSISAKQLKPNLMLVLDRSGSMRLPFDPTQAACGSCGQTGQPSCDPASLSVAVGRSDQHRGRLPHQARDGGPHWAWRSTRRCQGRTSPIPAAGSRATSAARPAASTFRCPPRTTTPRSVTAPPRWTSPSIAWGRLPRRCPEGWAEARPPGTAWSTSRTTRTSARPSSVRRSCC